MNKSILFFCVTGVFFSGCARQVHGPYEVVDESYMHRYGVPLQPSDWAERGESGNVVTTLKNGVVITRGYANGSLEGETTYTYPHSDLIEKVETYSQDKIVKEMHYYKNGTLSMQISYQPSNTRQIFCWYDNGAPQSSELCLNDLLLKGEYFTLTYQLDSHVENSQGVRTRRDPLGNLIGTDSIEGGVVSLTRAFYANGAVQQEIPYVQGEIQGELNIFLPSGEPFAIENWVAGQKTGIATFFENGERVSEIPYVGGVKDGIEKRYRDGEIVVERISWVQDVRHGPTTTTVGGITTIDFYYHGKQVTKSVFEKMTNGMMSTAKVGN
jgi:antitoxin component YwqK of YwqJK toxin-antitoxin module